MEVWLLCACAYIKWKYERKISHNIRKFEFSLRFFTRCLQTRTHALLRVHEKCVYVSRSPHLFICFAQFTWLFTYTIVNKMYVRDMSKMHDSIEYLCYSKKAPKWKMNKKKQTKVAIHCKAFRCCSYFVCLFSVSVANFPFGVVVFHFEFSLFFAEFRSLPFHQVTKAIIRCC